MRFSRVFAVSSFLLLACDDEAAAVPDGRVERDAAADARISKVDAATDATTAATADAGNCGCASDQTCGVMSIYPDYHDTPVCVPIVDDCSKCAQDDECFVYGEKVRCLAPGVLSDGCVGPCTQSQICVYRERPCSDARCPLQDTCLEIVNDCNVCKPDEDCVIYDAFDGPGGGTVCEPKRR